eukprot:TRINITY_DN746_c0_g1_i1.p1 TRINITY_DN746_c0_g1~~TRINITY_DN746_c0_g1_i1.p1  ORF type:complete len:173 (+),score=37.43 TRINITY_DN746_c0_g1_i1:32-520(+)
MPFSKEDLMSTILEHSKHVRGRVESLFEAYKVAKKEWHPHMVYEEPGGQCICGHRPITMHCVIKNEHNGKELILGNVCIKKFGHNDGLEMKLQTIMKGLQKLRKGGLGNRALRRLCFKRQIITKWELDFANNIEGRQSGLSFKQSKCQQVVLKKMQKALIRV